VLSGGHQDDAEKRANVNQRLRFINWRKKMVDWHAVIAVFMVYVAGVVVPGPNFVAVAHKAVSAGRMESLALVVGIVVVNLFWSASAILGVGFVFRAFPILAFVIRLAGAAYLIWFGLRLYVKAGGKVTSRAVAAEADFKHSFLQGVATNVANPKSIAFYAAVFASATPSHVSLVTFGAMVITVGVVAFAWYGFVAIALSHKGISDIYRERKRSIDRGSGSLIVFLGLRQLIR
jgi:threonine/homoserine/homoserine lactone efflux protein